MSAATLETPTDAAPSPRRTASTNRPRNEQIHEAHSYERSFELALDSATKDAMEGLRTFLPYALLRPTTAVDYVFDIVEAGVGVSRRTVRSLAGIVESGIEATERASLS